MGQDKRGCGGTLEGGEVDRKQPSIALGLGSRKTPAPNLWTSQFWLISLASYGVHLSFGMLLVTLPLYVRTLGASEGIVGLVTGVFPASALLARPFVGRELDRRGRAGTYRLGLAIFSLSVLLYRWADTPTLVLAVRVMHGFAWGIITTAAGTIVADVVPPTRRGEGIGYWGLFMNLASAVAPALGLHLIHRYGFPSLLYVSLSLVLVAFFIACKLKLDRPPQPKVASGWSGTFFEAQALLPAILTLLLGFSNTSFNTFLPICAQERNITNVGLFFTVQASALILVRPLAGRLFDRRGPTLVLIAGFCSVTLALILASGAGTLPALLVAGLLYGAGSGAALPSLQALAVAGLPWERRGAANATYFAALDIGVGTGNVVLGMVAQQFGFFNMYLLTASGSLLGLIGYAASTGVRQLQRKRVGSDRPGI